MAGVERNPRGCGLRSPGLQLRSALPAVPVISFRTKASTYPKLASGLGAGGDKCVQDLLGHSQSVPFGSTAALLTNVPLRKVGQDGYEALGGGAVARAETAGLVDLHLWGFCTNILYSVLILCLVW